MVRMLSSSRLTASLNGSTTRVHDLAQVVAALQPDALHPAGPHVVDQHAGNLGHLFFMRLDVGTRAVQPFFLAGEEDEADGAAWA